MVRTWIRNRRRSHTGPKAHRTRTITICTGNDSESYPCITTTAVTLRGRSKWFGGRSLNGYRGGIEATDQQLATSNRSHKRRTAAVDSAPPVFEACREVVLRSRAGK